MFKMVHFHFISIQQCFVACHAFVLCRESKHLQYILSYSANKERTCKQVVITFSPFFVTSW